MQDLTKIFNLNKVKMDIWNDLRLKKADVLTYDSINDIKVLVNLDIEDEITILYIRHVIPDARVNMLPYLVKVGFGDIKADHGVVVCEKCTADLIYNHDFNLVDIDFFGKVL
jgi:hypothetical protein